MSFDFVAICDTCEHHVSTNDEGELPHGWYGLLTKRGFDDLLGVYCSLPCLQRGVAKLQVVGVVPSPALEVNIHAAG